MVMREKSVVVVVVMGWDGWDRIGWMGQQPGWVGFVNFGFAPVCLEGVLRGH